MSRDQKEIKKNQFVVKVLKNKKVIKIYIAISCLIIAMIIGLNFYKYQFTKTIYQKYDAVNKDISDIKKLIIQTKEEIRKASEYKQLWILKNPNKKFFDGIEPARINIDFESMADDYYLDEYKISLSRPQKITEKPYENKAFDSYFMDCEISFNAINDLYAFNFIYEFIKKSKGILFIKNLEINKKKSYSEKDLVSISKGEFGTFAVSVNLKLKWLFFKKKENDESKK